MQGKNLDTKFMDILCDCACVVCSCFVFFFAVVGDEMDRLCKRMQPRNSFACIYWILDFQRMHRWCTSFMYSHHVLFVHQRMYDNTNKYINLFDIFVGMGMKATNDGT